MTLLPQNFNPSQDVLGFTPQSGITGSYNATTGVLTLSGTASVAAYQAALRSVTYFNSSNFPNGGLLTPVSRTVQFTVNDGAAINGIGSAFRSITITPINHVPTFTLNAAGDHHPALRECRAADDQPDGHQRRRQHDAELDELHRHEQQPGLDP